MNYVVLVAPFIIVALAVIGIVLLLFKQFKTGGLVILLSILYNVYTESVPMVPHFGSEKGDLKVLSYNMFQAGPYFKSVQDNPKDMVDFLLKQDADVLVLHEYFIYSCGALRDSLLKEYQYYEHAEEFDCSIAVFSKYPISPLEDMFLDVDNDEWIQAKLSQAKDYDHLRRMNSHRAVSGTWLKVGNDSIRLIAAHLASNHFDDARKDMSDEELRKRDKAKTFMKCLKAGRIEREVEARHIYLEAADRYAKGEKVIVAGDMNDVSGSSTMKVLQTDNVLNNAWWKKGFGMGLTFHSHKVMHFRLDHILYTDNLKLKNVSVLEQNYSDHHALVANFDL